MPKELEPTEKTNLVLRIGNRVPFSGRWMFINLIRSINLVSFVYDFWFIGLICAVLAGISFVGSKILTKKVTTVHPTVNVTIRGLLIMIIYGSIVLSKRVSLFGRNKKEFLNLCGRGFFGFIVCVTSYTALWRIPLGDSVTLLLTATIFTSILAKIFLKEEFNLINLICLVLTMLGTLFIVLNQLEQTLF